MCVEMDGGQLNYITWLIDDILTGSIMIYVLPGAV